MVKRSQIFYDVDITIFQRCHCSFKNVTFNRISTLQILHLRKKRSSLFILSPYMVLDMSMGLTFFSSVSSVCPSRELSDLSSSDSALESSMVSLRQFSCFKNCSSIFFSMSPKMIYKVKFQLTEVILAIFIS